MGATDENIGSGMIRIGPKAAQRIVGGEEELVLRISTAFAERREYFATLDCGAKLRFYADEIWLCGTHEQVAAAEDAFEFKLPLRAVA